MQRFSIPHTDLKLENSPGWSARHSSAPDGHSAFRSFGCRHGRAGQPEIGRTIRYISPDNPKEPNRETEVQTKFLHLFRDFSQSGISRHISGNSAQVSNTYF